jgi:flagellar hook-associated protein 1
VSFVGLYTGLTGIRAAQTGLDITGHNVANVGTPGYTRQRVELAARPVYQSPAGPVGTGVDVQSIGRLRDGFLDARFRSASADHAQASVHADVLTQLEALSGEPDQGISTRLARLWEAAESWANAPGDPAARRQVLSELASVTDTIRTTAASWQQLGDDVTDRHKTQVDVTTGVLEALEKLDSRLAGADPNRVGPDLMDQRDLLLDQVARLTGATIGIDEQGRAYATIDGHDLLRGGRLGELQHEPGPPSSLTLTPAADADGDTPDAVTNATLGGELGGLRKALDDIDRLGRNLDGFAGTFADAINLVNGDAGGEPLLQVDDPAGRSIRLADGLQPHHLIAGTSGGLHDNTNAIRFASLRTTKIGDDGGQLDSGATIENRLSDLIVNLAGDVRAAKATASGARAVASGANLARVSEHGVSIDEEMVSLVRYQRALEAASRVMTTVDEALNVLVNRTGIVGR